MKEKLKLILFLSYLSSHYINTHNSSTAKEIYKDKRAIDKPKKERKLVTELTGNAQARVGNVKHYPKVLLLQVGYHIQNRVHVAGRRRHCQARKRP